ncbi:hypothetical protein AGMMS49982_12420 [Bacteroidia bacterium]|nr:hypothetical protein AGMMS49982_12420 [Bacteroidia bacterium]
MKQLFFISAITCLTLASCGGKSDSGKEVALDPDLKKEHLNGNVESVRQRVYWCLEKFGRLEKGKRQNLSGSDYLKVFDKDGFLTEETHYNATDEVVSVRRITYTAAHQPLSETIYKGTNLDETIAYTYDINNVLTQKDKFDKDGNISESTRYTYFPDGRVMDEDLYNKAGSLTRKYVHIYNEAHLRERAKYWGGGSLAQKEYYEYDANNFLSAVYSEKYTNKVATPEKRVEYSDYNTFGDYSLRLEYDEEGQLVAKKNYKYDAQGNLTEYIPTSITRKVNAAAEPDATAEPDVAIEADDTIESDDETYSPIEEIWVQQVGGTYTYEYDTNNNWVTKITYKIDENSNSTRQFYYERVISYR